MSNKFDGPRKSANIGDLQCKEDYKDGAYENSLYEVRGQDGTPTGEYLQNYQIKVYIPDDVDEAGIGEPSLVLKKDQYINARALSEFEIGRLPDFLLIKDEQGNITGSKVACKLSVGMDRKQYPKKAK